MQKARRALAQIAGRFLFIGISVQIVLGICWMIRAFGIFPEFGDSYLWLRAADTLVCDDYMGIGYPLFLMLAKGIESISSIPYPFFVYTVQITKLGIKWEYLVQIFQVGVPAGIQSVVINFSNVLLQSSVNSFGSIAMAGYTAANNIFGFLFVSVNSITQACMSFTSQNYGAGKKKRMDRVLVDCMILSVIVAVTLGGGANLFGPQLLHIYTTEADVIACGTEILLYTTLTYFLCGIMDLIPGALRGMGHSAVPMILSIIGTVGTRIFWIYWVFPMHRSLMVLFLSYPASWTVTILLQAVCFYFVRKKVHSTMPQEET